MRRVVNHHRWAQETGGFQSSQRSGQAASGRAEQAAVVVAAVAAAALTALAAAALTALAALQREGGGSKGVSRDWKNRVLSLYAGRCTRKC